MKKILINTKHFIEKTSGIEVKRSRPPIVNEAVNLDKKTIFIAIPKTGTTSVRTQIRKDGNPIISNAHLNIVQIRDLLYIHLLKLSLGKNLTFPNEDIPEDLSLRKEANEIFDSCFKFSAVRNPWARAVSLYFRREGATVKDKMSFEEFCEKHFYANDTCRHPTLHKNQYDWLCDENGENLMDYIYKVENFENAINDIKRLTDGRVKLINVKRNSNPNSQSNNYRNLYNDYTRKIIAKRFEKDIDIFKYTF